VSSSVVCGPLIQRIQVQAQADDRSLAATAVNQLLDPQDRAQFFEQYVQYLESGGTDGTATSNDPVEAACETLMVFASARGTGMWASWKEDVPNLRAPHFTTPPASLNAY
jgi:hypothetical protein